MWGFQKAATVDAARAALRASLLRLREATSVVRSRFFQDRDVRPSYLVYPETAFNSARAWSIWSYA